MLTEFISFVESVFPSIDPSISDNAKAAIKQFEREGDQPPFLTTNVLPELSQGDILDNIPFAFFDENGDQYYFVSKAIVLSTSCNIDNKGFLELAPVLPIDGFCESSLMDLKHNIVFDYMFLPDASLSNDYVDFSIISTYNKQLLMDGIENGDFHRIASLNQLGYYLFIVKLSVFFMRKEDTLTLAQRKSSDCFQ